MRIDGPVIQCFSESFGAHLLLQNLITTTPEEDAGGTSEGGTGGRWDHW